MMPPMAISIGGVSVPGPSEVLATARGAVDWGGRATSLLTGLPERADRLLDRIEVLLHRIDELAARADQLVARVDAVASAAAHTVRVASEVTGDAAAVITRASSITDGAAAVITRASSITDGAASVVTGAEQITASASSVVLQAGDATRSAAELLRAIEPVTAQGMPLASTFVNELSEQEVAAAVRMVDQLPRLAEHLETDIMPVLATLDRVGPDMHELLNVVKDLRQAIDGVPGLAYFRRRGQQPALPDPTADPPPA